MATDFLFGKNRHICSVSVFLYAFGIFYSSHAFNALFRDRPVKLTVLSQAFPSCTFSTVPPPNHQVILARSIFPHVLPCPPFSRSMASTITVCDQCGSKPNGANGAGRPGGYSPSTDSAHLPTHLLFFPQLTRIVSESNAAVSASFFSF